MKNISGKTMIFYTFQSANKSIQFNITTFKKSAPQQPKIRDVLYELPLDFSNNSFHFRFRSEFFEGDDKIIGWIDISNLLAKVPVINNNIFVKILQLPGDKQNKLFNKQKLKAIGLIDPHQNIHKHNINNNNVSNPKTVNTKKETQQSKKDIDNFLDFQQTPKKNHQHPKVKSENKSPKKQFEDESKKKQNISQSPPAFVPGGQSQQQILKRFKAQCEVQDEERNLQRKAIVIHEQKLNEWGYSGHKTINNLTTLLATLHTIWPQWTSVSLTELLTPQAVNQVYRKAVIRLHPDKNVGKDYQTKYLAKRIFELLNEARKAQK